MLTPAIIYSLLIAYGIILNYVWYLYLREQKVTADLCKQLASSLRNEQISRIEINTLKRDLERLIAKRSAYLNRIHKN